VARLRVRGLRHRRVLAPDRRLAGPHDDAHGPRAADAASDALEQALHDHEADAGLVHHSNHGVQYLSVRYSERLAEAGIAASVGSHGDSYDNALAESLVGLYKAEVIHHAGPARGFDDVEYATLEWVAWFNTQRLLAPLGYVPPADFAEQFYRSRAARAVPVAIK
jgi:transposase InsO family protein